MAKINKKNRQELIKKNFPEFWEKLSEFDRTLDAINTEMEDKLGKIEEIKDKKEEYKDQVQKLRDDEP